MQQQPAISLRGLTKTFGSVVAVNNLNLDIAPGEFFSMLGPSGSGKTTVLRLIAGFEKPSSGSIELFGQDVSAVPPFEREVNTVFQDYALFPHMTVQENIEYGLKVQKVPKDERQARVQEALRTVRLADLGERKPSQLSGGQRQRIALARAIVVQPKVLLLDEPLGALDLKLREEMQVELKEIQRELGITFIFVTHDQAEALSLSDRVAVFDGGNIVQVGTPREIYSRPENRFVAGFVGSSTIFTKEESQQILGIDSICAVRPEHIEIDADGQTGPGWIQLDAEIVEENFTGSSSLVTLQLSSGKRVLATSANGAQTKPLNHGQRVRLTLATANISQLAH
jgi:putative spermidine/putrescine transport system ATP-binding protein